MVTSCPLFIGRIAIAIGTACGDKFTARIGTSWSARISRSTNGAGLPSHVVIEEGRLGAPKLRHSDDEQVR